MLHGFIGRGSILLVILTALFCLLMVSLHSSGSGTALNSTAPSYSPVPPNTTTDAVSILEPPADPDATDTYYTQDELQERFLLLFRAKNWKGYVNNLKRNVCIMNDLIYEWFVVQQSIIREDIIADMQTFNFDNLLSSALIWLNLQAAAIGLDTVLEVMNEPSFMGKIHSEVLEKAGRLARAYNFEMSTTNDTYDATEQELDIFRRAIRMVIRHGKRTGVVALMYIMEAVVTDFRLSRSEEINFFYARCIDFISTSPETPKEIITRKDISHVAKDLWYRIMLSCVFCVDKKLGTIDHITCVRDEFRKWIGRSYETMLMHAPKMNITCNSTLN